MTPYELAEHLTAELKRLGAPVIGSFAWSPDRIVLDYWTDDGRVEHVIILQTPVANDCAPFVAAALMPGRPPA